MNRKRTILLTAVSVITICVVAGVLFSCLVMRFQMPDSSMEPLIRGQTSSGRADVVLLTRGAHARGLKRGDLVLLERPGAGGSVRTIRKIVQEDDSSRVKVSGRGTGRRGAMGRSIAQAILDMDYEPRFVVAALQGPESTNLVQVAESAIRGKVFHVFKRRAK